MENPELDRAIWAVGQAINELIKDGILAINDNGIILTEQGEAWYAIREKVRKERANSKGRSKR